jgi:putative (di)nucleoside polyphosphate hydrolase
MHPTDTTRPDPNQLPYRRGVGLCVFNKQGLVLCAERRDYRGAWQMPQGGIQKGEEPPVAAMRELKEEVGTDHVRLLAQVAEPLRYEFPDYMQYRNGVFHGKYRGQEQVWFAGLFLGSDDEIDISGKDEPETPEFVAWRWEKLEVLPSLIVDFKRPVYDRAVKEFVSLRDRIAKGEAV